MCTARTRLLALGDEMPLLHSALVNLRLPPCTASTSSTTHRQHSSSSNHPSRLGSSRSVSSGTSCATAPGKCEGVPLSPQGSVASPTYSSRSGAGRGQGVEGEEEVNSEIGRGSGSSARRRTASGAKGSTSEKAQRHPPETLDELIALALQLYHDHPPSRLVKSSGLLLHTSVAAAAELDHDTGTWKVPDTPPHAHIPPRPPPQQRGTRGRAGPVRTGGNTSQGGGGGGIVGGVARLLRRVVAGRRVHPAHHTSPHVHHTFGGARGGTRQHRQDDGSDLLLRGHPNSSGSGGAYEPVSRGGLRQRKGQGGTATDGSGTPGSTSGGRSSTFVSTALSITSIVAV
jgi:hypothetical protein